MNAACNGGSPAKRLVRRTLQAATDALKLCEPMGVTEPNYLTTGEAARALKVNPTTLQRWVHKYGIRPSYVTGGGHFRWDLDDLRTQLHARYPDLESDSAPAG